MKKRLHSIDTGQEQPDEIKLTNNDESLTNKASKQQLKHERKVK
jgi:hypothetical protein